MTSDDNEERSARPALTLEMLEKAARSRRGPVKRFTLFCSGVNPKLLRLVPSEEAWFAVIGSLVVVTTLTAGFGAFATAGYYFAGGIAVTQATVAAGVGWATLIFVVERAIVRTPLNQVRFSADVMEMLSGPEMDAVFQEITDGTRVQAVKRTPGSYAGVAAAISTRLGIAFLASYLVAESILLTIYGPEIEPIVAVRANQISTEVLLSDSATRQTALDDIDLKIAERTAVVAPDLVAAQTALPKQKAAVLALENDVALIGQTYAAECNGRKVAHTLSTGLVVRSTGKKGCGSIAPGELLDLEEAYQDKVVAAQDVVTATLGVIDTQQAAIAGDPGLVALLDQKGKLACQQRSSEDATEPPPIENVSADVPAKQPQRKSGKGKGKGGAGKAQAECADTSLGAATGMRVHGIGIREAALRDLEEDTDPATVAIERAAPCSNVACSVSRFVVYPSPVGRKMASIRWILFLIEISAVLTKVAFVLRRRRPYDTLVAAMEVVQEGRSVALAGTTLADIGGDMEQRSATRRKERPGAVPDVLVKRSERRHPTSPKPERRRRRRGQRGGRRSMWRLLGRTDDISEDEEFPPPPA